MSLKSRQGMAARIKRRAVHTIPSPRTWGFIVVK